MGIYTAIYGLMASYVTIDSWQLWPGLWTTAQEASDEMEAFMKGTEYDFIVVELVAVGNVGEVK